ncbi:MAG: hypothetical protein JW852_06600 [Spirochaetales bacterium]|nr:hypothetical protein [Spirochaetales bacterium]
MKKYRCMGTAVPVLILAAALAVSGCKWLLPDKVAPGNVTGLCAVPGYERVVLTWVNPSDIDFAGVLVVFSLDKSPETIESGTKIYSGKGTTYTHAGVTNDTTCRYTVFAFDDDGNFSSGASVSATPAAGLLIGELVWEKTIDFAGGYDCLYSAAIDGQYDVVAAGYYDPDPATTDYGTTAYAVKYDSSGNKLWDDELEVGPIVAGGKASSDDMLYDVAVDADDNVYLTGQISGTFTTYTLGSYHTAFLVIAYDATGTFRWEDIWQQSSSSPWHEGLTVAIDAGGNIYAGGRAFLGWGLGEGAWAVRKYDASGQSLWEPALIYNYNTGSDSNDRCEGLCIDGEDNIICCGRNVVSYPDAATYDFDWHVRKYGADKNLLWSSSYAGAQNRNDCAFAVDTDSAGNVFVAGYMNKGAVNSGDGANYDWLVKKYSKDGSGGDGELLWTYQYETYAGASEGCYALAVDTDGDVLVCGSMKISADERAARIVKLNNEDGAELDELVFPADYGMTPLDITVRRNVVVIVGTKNTATNSDMFVMYLVKSE